MVALGKQDKPNTSTQLFVPPVGVSCEVVWFFGPAVPHLKRKGILPLPHSNENERRRKARGTQTLLWRHRTIVQS